MIGIETVHPYYPDPTPGVNLDTGNIIDLGKIGDTNFHAIPAPLPTLAFMYDGGPAGHFFYDSFSPFATLVDDWGYGNPGDPGAGITVDGIDPIGVAGPWQVDATGQLVLSGGAGFLHKMDPLQMLAGMEYAAVQTLIGPINDLLADAGQSPLPTSFVDSLLSGYDSLNQLDASLLTEWTDLDGEHPVAGAGRHPRRLAADLRAAADRPRRIRVRRLQLLRRLTALTSHPYQRPGMHYFSEKHRM